MYITNVQLTSILYFLGVLFHANDVTSSWPYKLCKTFRELCGVIVQKPYWPFTLNNSVMPSVYLTLHNSAPSVSQCMLCYFIIAQLYDTRLTLSYHGSYPNHTLLPYSKFPFNILSWRTLVYILYLWDGFTSHYIVLHLPVSLYNTLWHGSTIRLYCSWTMQFFPCSTKNILITQFLPPSLATSCTTFPTFMSVLLKSPLFNWSWCYVASHFNLWAKRIISKHHSRCWFQAKMFTL